MKYSEIGLIADTHATHDDEGNELTPITYLPGWHVNTLEPVEGWEQYRCHPAVPYRIYTPPLVTVCYRFPDEATFRALLPDDEATDDV